MFDIGFSELLVIGVVALVVIGPERLPRVARTLGVLFGRLQRYVSQVKTDINREMDLAELNRVKNEFEASARSFQQDVESTAAKTESEIRDAQSQIDKEFRSSATDSVVPADDPTVFPKALIEEPPAPTAEAQAASPQLELGIDETEPTARERKAG
jgi:sec-independent protein translocase protein TatB